MIDLDKLWGGILDGIALDVVRLEVFMDVIVPNSTGEARYRLYLRGVSKFQFLNSIPGPWDYAELTELRATALPDNRIRLDIVLWSEQATIVVEADKAGIDRAAIELRA